MSAPALERGTTDPRTALLGRAARALRDGRPVLLTGCGPVRVVLAAHTASFRTVAWTVRHTSGLVWAALPAERAAQLCLPRMNGTDVAAAGPVETVSVDATAGIGTGISARDRARTLQVLADPATAPADLVHPGHVLVRLVRPGVRGPGELAVALCAQAGLPPVAAVAELVDDRGALASDPDALDLAARYGVATVAAAALPVHPIGGNT